ncbi:hypothetical protein AHMF7605_20120 [Adhaeribacter arboris]|uniref:Uncharacterized protein n=1 Tax=Adhaeribacter arboris TaxID=2072846 RepID=A0A2T2YJG6_9BACT|nr:hypothetical protein [Adhaeribacter arboris]PSR55647.1 hypothetical protein AHMF7605_20120 [Adhaeribacter arboris]
MKQFFLFFTFLLYIAFASAHASTPAKDRYLPKLAAIKQQTPSIYVCEGISSYVYYYSENCAGLNSCPHAISAGSKTDTENSYSHRPDKK